MVTMANTTSSSPQRPNNISLRKTNKPLMEKRRRARINDSLSQLKSLVIQGTKKDSSQFNKLEKADILELTVKHLRNLQEQQQTPQSSNPSLATKYQAGFMECANEVMRYIGHSQGFTEDVKSRVIHHLASCIKLSTKPSFTRPQQQPNNTNAANSSSAMTNGPQTVNAQLSNGQIIQIVNTQFQNIKNSNTCQFPGSTAAAPTPSSLPVSTSTHIPVILTSDSTKSSSPLAEPLHVRYTQPLHIQIPPVLSPVMLQPKATQHQKQPQQQVPHKIQEIQRIPCSAHQETLVSSSAPSPQPTELTTTSPVLPTATQKPHFYYPNEDQYMDFMPRSRTYSLASSASTESELTSPLNLSQSPQYYDHKELINYSSQMDHTHFHTSTPEKLSPSHHFSRNSLFQSQFTSSNFTSVIVDGRKAADSHGFKYMHIMDEDRCFRHDGTSSPASSVGDERLWRPW